MVTNLSVRRFKSIESADLELGQVNVFIGANGSGKSNLLEAVALIAAAAFGRVDQESITRRGCRPRGLIQPMFKPVAAGNGAKQDPDPGASITASSSIAALHGLSTTKLGIREKLTWGGNTGRDFEAVNVPDFQFREASRLHKTNRAAEMSGVSVPQEVGYRLDPELSVPLVAVDLKAHGCASATASSRNARSLNLGNHSFGAGRTVRKHPMQKLGLLWR
jgi:energy-coupling factor transporter ATP-binding protein EcfA2